MSDLPSRERVADLGCIASSPEQAEDIEAILNAYRVGRLVDLEAIDYGLMEEILDEFGREWYDMVIREGKTFDLGVAIRALVAAIGDTGIGHAVEEIVEQDQDLLDRLAET